MADFRIDSKDFSSTTCTVEWISEKGKQLFEEFFGKGSVSVEMPKSKSLDFSEFVSRKGFSTI